MSRNRDINPGLEDFKKFVNDHNNSRKNKQGPSHNKTSKKTLGPVVRVHPINIGKNISNPNLGIQPINTPQIIERENAKKRYKIAENAIQDAKKEESKNSNALNNINVLTGRPSLFPTSNNTNAPKRESIFAKLERKQKEKEEKEEEERKQKEEEEVINNYVFDLEEERKQKQKEKEEEEIDEINKELDQLSLSNNGKSKNVWDSYDHFFILSKEKNEDVISFENTFIEYILFYEVNNNDKINIKYFGKCPEYGCSDPEFRDLSLPGANTYSLPEIEKYDGSIELFADKDWYIVQPNYGTNEFASYFTITNNTNESIKLPSLIDDDFLEKITITN